MLVLLTGVFGGIILGALPGVSPTLAVALLVPFTFYMDPTTGLILLGAVYAASVAGGAISAILINVPGAPANIATLLDGYPLARSGKAQSTLYMCFISSFIGGVFGMMIMIFLTLPLSEVALKFQSTEIFWISILGLTVVAGLGSGSIIKSLIAGAFGVWLSTIGANPTTGEFRFVFHEVLTGGIHIVPALIGLFAIPQVFTLIEWYGTQRTIIKFQPEKGIFFRTFLRTLKMVRVLGIGSIVGTIIGLIPGVGGQVAGIVAYDQAKKFSRHPEKYGTGIPDGVVAAESANNAMVGPSLVPLLTLSIPGSPTAAVLLGGLLIHGIFPGPNLFLLHGHLVNTFIGSLLLAQLLMLVFGIILSRYSYWVMRVPDLYMAASIIVLAVFGTYSVNNSFNDVIIMFSVGIVMYIASKFGFSPAPVVMGLILGGIAENSFLKGMLIASAGEGFLKYFFTGWINITIIILCVVSILFGVMGTLKDKGRKKVINRYDLIVAILVISGSLAIYKFALKVKDPLSAIFPSATLIIMAGLASLLLVQVLVSMVSNKKLDATGIDIPISKVVLLFLYTVVYFYSLNRIGFYLSSFLFYAVFPFLFRRSKDTLLKDLSVKIVVSCIFMGILYFLFNLILKVQTPAGAFI
ncbi:MAG: C4-dicarboxylate ABC transporter permease [Nitrospirae bacterium]|nr:C4-dicarboxylate ABC transporter permease [Nitrospirota bacterium]